MNNMKNIKEKNTEFIDNSLYLNLLKKQKYSIIGYHSAVKICHWSKKSIYNADVCYKEKFYGINSHRCIQMTPSLFCNQKCIFCWRAIEIKNPIIEKWDEPRYIFDESIKSQKKLLTGFGGSIYTNKNKYEESKKPSNVAISLSGEPTLYPYLDDLISLYNKKHIKTFIVTNGTNPEMIEKIKPSQLYISLDAPNKSLYNKICRPNNSSLWNNIISSLKIINNKKNENIKTAIRITVINEYNIQHASEFSNLINISLPNYIEIKSYMHIGFSRFRLERKNMVDMTQLLKFSMIICQTTKNYRIKNISNSSKVILLELIE